MSKWDHIADDQSISKTIAALKENGIEAEVVESGEDAKKKVLELIPEGSEVMAMTSMTLEAIGLASEIDESGRFNSVKKKLMAMNSETQDREMKSLGAAPEFSLGSVHAVTEEGNVLFASMTGSQLSAHVYAAGKVVWVVGAQKVVRDTDDGIRRIYEHCFPLEDQRAQKAYGIHSGVNKILIINREVVPGRITMILVKEKLGF